MKQILSIKEFRKMSDIAKTLQEYNIGSKEEDPRNKVEMLPDGNICLTSDEDLTLKTLNVVSKWLPVVLSQAKALMGTLELAFGDYEEATKVPKAKVDIKDLDKPLGKPVSE